MIWIVEDLDDDARKAYEVAVSVAREKFGDEHTNSVKIFRSKLIEWPPELRAFAHGGSSPKLELVAAKPGIVVLDLFDNGIFAAPEFLQALRAWEQGPRASEPTMAVRSFVILWTIKSYRDDVSSFLQQERERDRRVDFTQTKNRVSLRQQLEGFWRQWEEEKAP